MLGDVGVLDLLDGKELMKEEDLSLLLLLVV